ncbi:fibrous sheath-interacting protein 2 [Esox lucius]|uniref:fibrous sheath-interacting protein 2 n=1 Tax=Esox lucius TaxID=8010 RepID=UPI001476FE8E|nr:fibrous sheath-interacting protein 2 [Esox lucius]
MPIRGKIPAISGLCSVYHTTRLCERLVQPKSDFDLTDPNGYLLSSVYSSLHDPNLSNYLHRKDIHQRLLDLGFITKEQKIICSLKELNRYRDHLVEVELDWSRRFQTEQKELVRKFLNLKQQGQIPEHISLSDVTEWLLHRGRRLFSKRQQAIMTRSFPDNYTRLPKIAMRSNVVDLVCCPSSPCRSKRIWNAKGRALLHEVTKEVKREMRLEQHMLTNRQKKEKANQEKQQKRMCFKGCKKKRHSLTKTDPQDSPESMGNTFGSDPDNTQVDLVGCATTSISAHQPSSNPEQKCEGLSAVCQDMIESMNQKSPISYHNLCAKGPGLVDTISSSLIPRGILLGQGGYLQSITKQLSEIEQRLLEEHIKGTITAEELHGIMQSVVVSVVEEVNRILIPAIMAFEVERRTNSISTTNGTSSDVPTYSSLSYSDSYKTSSVSGSQKSSSPVIELSSEIPAPPTMLFKPTPCVIRQETFTVSVPEKDNREPNIETERGASCFMDLASSSSPSSSEKQSSPSKTSPSATSLESSGDILKSGTSIDAGRKEEKKLLVKAGAVIQEVIWRAAEAEGDKRDGGRLRNMSHAEKVETDSKTIEAVSRDIRGERRVEGVENNVDAITTIEVQKWENFADSVAKTVVLEVLAIADTTTKTDHSEVSKLEEKEMIADVTPKTESKELATAVVVTENVEAEKGDTRGGVKVKTDVKEGFEITKLDIQVAKAEASFDSKNKWTEMLDPKTEEADADINKPEQDKTVAQNNRKRYDFILLAGESKTEIREKHRNAKESLNNTQAEMSEHLYGSHELSQSISNDDDGALMFPMISMLKNAAISSDQVNEILDKVCYCTVPFYAKVVYSFDSVMYRSTSHQCLVLHVLSRQVY